MSGERVKGGEERDEVKVPGVVGNNLCGFMMSLPCSIV